LFYFSGHMDTEGNISLAEKDFSFSKLMIIWKDRMKSDERLKYLFIILDCCNSNLWGE